MDRRCAAGPEPAARLRAPRRSPLCAGRRPGRWTAPRRSQTGCRDGQAPADARLPSGRPVRCRNRYTASPGRPDSSTARLRECPAARSASAFPVGARARSAPARRPAVPRASGPARSRARGHSHGRRSTWSARGSPGRTKRSGASPRKSRCRWSERRCRRIPWCRWPCCPRPGCGHSPIRRLPFGCVPGSGIGRFRDC